MKKLFSLALLLCAAVQGTWAYPEFAGGDGSANNPYIISTSAQWDELGEEIAKGFNTIGMYFQLDADITVTTMLGTDDDHEFSGSFDGNYRTLTFDCGTESDPFGEEYCAPFRYINQANFSNLTVEGTICTNNQFAAGFVGHAIGYNNFNNCVSNITINSSVNGDGTHGGFVANIQSGSTTLDDCAFTGSLNGSDTHSWGGFVGWTESDNSASVRFDNCLFRPGDQNGNDSESATFSRGRVNNTTNITIEDCYYTTAYGDTQGGIQAYASDDSAPSTTLVGETIAGIDFFLEVENTCQPTTDDITANSATISWNTMEGFTYQLRYRVREEDTVYGGDYWMTEDYASSGITITGLEANTQYECQLVYTDGDKTYYSPFCILTTNPDGEGGEGGEGDESDLTLEERNYPPFDISVDLSSSNLPLVIISTDEMLSRYDRKFGKMTVINNPDGNNSPDLDGNPDQHLDFDGPVSIKWRGNTSFGDDNQTKKPISIKTLRSDATGIDGKKQAVSLLGMGADNDWCLLAPWQDKSYSRDILTQQLARGGQVFTPQMRLCEVFLNDVYYGVYILCERATTGAARLDLWTFGKDAEGNAISDLTGDFLVEIDRGYNPFLSVEEPHYQSPHHPVNSAGQPYDGNGLAERYISYQYGYPEESDFDEDKLGDGARQAVEDAISLMEDSFCSDDDAVHYADHIDVLSFIDFEIAQEVANNIDGYRLSTPLWKHSTTHARAKGGNDKWKFALWDFNLGYGNANYYEATGDVWRYAANDIMCSADGDGNLIPFFWHTLMNDEAYTKQLVIRYTERRQTAYSDERVTAICDSLRDLLDQGAALRDNQAWSGQFEQWSNEIEMVKQYTEGRLQWIDQTLYDPDAEHFDPSTFTMHPVEAYGYNMDVICENPDDIGATVSSGEGYGIDKDGWVFYTSEVKDEGSLCTYDGDFQSERTTYHTDVEKPNALVLGDGQLGGNDDDNDGDDDSQLQRDGTLHISDPVKARRIFFTATAANGAGKLSVTANYTDGSQSDDFTFFVPDWAHGGAAVAVDGLGRMLSRQFGDKAPGTLSESNKFKLFEFSFLTDFNKQVESLTFESSPANPDENPDCRIAIFTVAAQVPFTDLTLAGTTLWKDGSWNTLCLPFELSSLSGTPLEGATVKTLESSSFSGGDLTLNFSNNLSSIEAGKPYIVKWESGSNDDNPTFHDVVILRDIAPAETEWVDFIGSFSPITLEAQRRDVLYLGDASTLYYPTADITINPYHAYFQLKQDLTVGGSESAPIRTLRLNFGDEETGIEEVNGYGLWVNGYGAGWCTLDGRRLLDKPSSPGIYIHNGRKVLIK